MLAGDTAFIERAAPWRRRFGANPYTSFPYALSCRSGFARWSDTFGARWHKLRGLAPLLREVAAEEGGVLTFVPETPTCCQSHVFLGEGFTLDALDAARDAVDAEHGRRVYERLRSADDPLCLSRPVDATSTPFYFEWSLGPAHVEVDDSVFVDAWRAFFVTLRSGRE